MVGGAAVRGGLAGGGGGRLLAAAVADGLQAAHAAEHPVARPRGWHRPCQGAHHTVADVFKGLPVQRPAAAMLEDATSS